MLNGYPMWPVPPLTEPNIILSRPLNDPVFANRGDVIEVAVGQGRTLFMGEKMRVVAVYRDDDAVRYTLTRVAQENEQPGTALVTEVLDAKAA